jgi:diketogulonate reductase-like aldo/keto reductase
MTRTDVVKYCTERGIVLEAWAPLTRCMRFQHPAITALAGKYNKEPAQILLRYSLQKVANRILPIDQRLPGLHFAIQGYVPLPKSSNNERLVSNTQIFDFELQKEEVEHLDTLDEGGSNFLLFMALADDRQPSPGNRLEPN